jgi:hypothetical protein
LWKPVHDAHISYLIEKYATQSLPDFGEGGGTRCRRVGECGATRPQMIQKSRRASHPTRIRRATFPESRGGIGGCALPSLAWYIQCSPGYGHHMARTSEKCCWGPAQDEHHQRRLKSSAFFAANSSSVRMFFWRRSARPSIVLRMSTAAKDVAVGTATGAAATEAAAFVASGAG